MAGGSHPSSPFGKVMENTKKAVDACLRRLGLDPDRRGSDRDSEVAFRRLKAMAEVCEDEDFDWRRRCLS